MTDARTRAQEPLIPVDCAVNDDYGSVGDRISAIHFPGLELDACDMRGPRFREIRRNGEFLVRIGRCEYAVRHVRSCVGNIYWERYAMGAWTAAHCLHRLRGSRDFTFDYGYDELATWWETSIEDHAHVRRLLIDAAKDHQL